MVAEQSSRQVLRLSPTQIKAWQLCPQKWQYYTQRWKPAVPSVPLSIGFLVHDALEQFYKTETRSLGLLLAALHTRFAEFTGGYDIQARERYEHRWSTSLAHCEDVCQTFWDTFGTDDTVPSTGVEESSVRLLRLGSTDSWDCDIELRCRHDVIDRPTRTLWSHKTRLSAIDPVRFTVFEPQHGLEALAAFGPDVDSVTVYCTVLRPDVADRYLVPVRPPDSLPLVIGTARAILSGDVIPHCGSHCMGCEYKPVCLLRLTGGDWQQMLEEDYTKERKEETDGDT